MLLACRIIPPIPSQLTKIMRSTFSTNTNCNNTMIRLVEQASPNRQTILHQMLFSHLSLPHSRVEQSIKRNKTIHTWIEQVWCAPPKSATTVGASKNKENKRAINFMFFTSFFSHICVDCVEFWVLQWKLFYCFVALGGEACWVFLTSDTCNCNHVGVLVFFL